MEKLKFEDDMMENFVPNTDENSRLTDLGQIFQKLRFVKLLRELRTFSVEN